MSSDGRPAAGGRLWAVVRRPPSLPLDKDDAMRHNILGRNVCALALIFLQLYMTHRV